ncbi:recombinase family protein [Streptomyces olivaceus]|uniref:Recombinase family protein n=1 Tax=Streptomyces olivaceus TaxID=47716 RepID=A0ABS7W0I0_STROV|nr:recombinase family protein [Streptomyces olivaceus]MBZ6088983.1 recombinase family protein [Streptomyces olivaceus]MBZ6095643.1 recombinase family protein [Streptomyces olivaceus]MBZ6119912.1 recombinase family protein [Streptomyces olivaceus]MBZ6151463.1 recombinase family protein [Streptomyces olivaceus]MBZ6298415.1 recombinase family protein [Streptomyces olivaceus]
MSQPTCVIYDRLSRLFAEEAPDHRIAACKSYAEARGWKVVHVATDTNVSGASKLEDRPGMREVLAWLPRADYVLAAKLDRYARSVLEFQRLLRAADSTRTTIVTADGVVSPENASIIINVLAAFAEYERDMITARITESKKHFRSRGNHLGGLAPYGYAVSGPVNNKRWVIDETAAAVLREATDRLLRHGASLSGLARELNDRGTLPPADHARQRAGRELRGQRWHSTTLRDALYSPAVRGWLIQAVPGTKRGALTNQPVLDAAGNPVSAGPAILSAEDWSAVRALIDGKARGRGSDRTGKALLLHIARCSECDGPMYRQRRTVNGKDYSSYVCRKGVGKLGIHRPNVATANYIEEFVTADFLRRFGDFTLMRWAEPDGSAVLQLSEVTQQIERLAGNLAQLDPNGTAARVAIAQITALEARQAELQRESAHAVGRWVDTGTTIGSEWRQRDDEGRRALLADLGARLEIRPAVPGAPRRFDAGRLKLSYEGPAWRRGVDPLTASELEADLEEAAWN